MAEIVITEFMDEGAVAGLRRDYGVVYDPTLVDRPDELLPLLGDCRGLIVRNRTQVRGALLGAAPGLRVVGRLGVGLDNIDVEACAARGVEVFPATGANDLSVAEYVVTTALLLLRGAYLSRDAMLAGLWPRDRLMGRELSGRTVGLVGFGGIAREVAVRAIGLGAACIAYDPYLADSHSAWDLARRSDLPELLGEADVVSLHVPLTTGTRHLIDAAALGRMRADAVLINAARGGVVDEAALALALKEGRLAGAALDVFETEPLTREAAQPFVGIANLVLTPHIAGVTVESNRRVSAVTALNVRQVLARRPKA
jgi:(S)-sulfolactate dehydrogenase